MLPTTPCAPPRQFIYLLYNTNTPPTYPPLTYCRTRYRNPWLRITGLLLVRVARLPSFSSLAYISYAIRVWPHSPCWPLLLHVARLTSLLLTYVRTCARNAVLGITGLHLVHVARLASFLADLRFVRVARLLSLSLLAYISYALLVWPQSPR